METRKDPLKGVHQPELLLERIKARDYSYVRGSLQVLERKPPNPYIVPVLKKALEKFRAAGP